MARDLIAEAQKTLNQNATLPARDLIGEVKAASSPAAPRFPTIADEAQKAPSLDRAIAGRPKLSPADAAKVQVFPDTWSQTGSKFLARVGPNLRQWAGGLVESLAAADPTGGDDSMVMTAETFRMKEEASAAARAEIAAKIRTHTLPGQALYDSATKDLDANAYHPGDDSVKKYVPMVGEAITQMLPTIAITLATRNPMIGAAAMTPQVFGQQYGESLDMGRTPDQATMDATFMAGSEVIGEKIPLGMMMKPGGKFLLNTLKTAGAEGVQEVFTQILQTGYDKGLLHPDMTWGEARQQIIDAGIVGALTGGAMSVGARPFVGAGRSTAAAPPPTASYTPPPVPTGIIADTASAAATLTPDDKASPIPDAMIAQGRAELAKGKSAPIADEVLAGAGLPRTQTRVNIQMPSGQRLTGTITDAFDTDAGEAGRAQGVKIALDGGGSFDEHFDTIRDAGVKITPAPLDPADAPGVDPADLPRSTPSAAASPAVDPAPLSSPGAALAPAPSRSPSARGSFLAKVGRAESPSDTARNPNSSAQGRYQFTDGTWLGTYRKMFPGTGESDAQILAKKTDGALQDRLMGRLTADNDAVLRKSGFETTDGNRYLSHFAGAGGAVALLRADPNTPVEQVLGARAVAANPFLKGKTAGETVAWAARKMGERGGATSIDPADDGVQFVDLNFDEPAAASEAESGDAPAMAEQPEAPATTAEHPETAVTVTGRAVPVRYKVVEAADLVASNDAEGNPNPSYPAQLQPRDRSRGVSQTQVAEIASRLNPALLGRSPKASDGAPIVSPDNIVESGNGRTLAIRRAYDAGGQQAASYRQFIADQGFDVAGFTQPVLVRERAPMAPADVEAFTREANARDTLGYSATEQAASDAKAMSAGVLDLYRGGDLDTAGNRDFVRQFLNGVVAPTEYAAMVDAQGAISQAAVARVRGALLARAYGNQQLVAQAVESTDTDIKAIIGALTDVAGRWAQLVEAAGDGRVDPAMDISKNLNEAVALVDRARREGRSVADLAGQADAFTGALDPQSEMVLRLMFNRPDFTKPAGRGKLAERLGYFVEEALKAAPDGGLFGDATKASPRGILDLAQQKTADVSRSDQPDLLASPVQGQQPGRASDGGGEPARVERDGGSSRARVPAPAREQTRPDVTPSAPSTARVEDMPSGKSVAILGATDAELARVRDAIPKAQPIVNAKTGGTVYSKKYEAKIKAALAVGNTAVAPPAVSPATVTDEDPRLTASERGALEYVLRSDAKGGAGWNGDSSAGQQASDILAAGKTRNADDQRILETALRLQQRSTQAPAPTTPEGVTETVTPTPTTPEGYGSKNKIISADSYADIRAKLKAKLADAARTTNSGVDPELLALGTQAAIFHIEAGARKFADFAKALSDDLGFSLPELKRYLRSWYVGAQAAMEDAGEDVSDMDGPGAVRAAIAMIEDSAPAAPAAETQAPSASTTPEETVRDRLLAGDKFATITEARKLLEQATGEKVEPGTAGAKRADEAVEAGVVMAARKIAAREGKPLDTYRALVDLYQRQPSLNVRTSTSIEQQAYSTPVPLAFLASRRAGITQDTTVYEPSAGNGALLIDARATYVTANELNPDRAAALRTILPGAKITQKDALATSTDSQVDVVIANPPFGPVKGTDGENRVFQMGEGYETREIDHAIALTALDNMKNDGRAVLIVGSIPKTVISDDARSDAYNTKAKREFYLRLYSEYNVTDHFTVAGELYSRQGAGWPVDVIVIDGRGKSRLRVPAADVPRQYASWDALEDTLNGRPEGLSPATGAAPGNAAVESARPSSSDERSAGSSRGERTDRGNGRNPNDVAQPVREGSVDGQPARARLDEPAARNDAATDRGGRPDGSPRPAPVARAAPIEGENARQVSYSPASKGAALGTLVPVNMQTATRTALDALQRRVGAVDSYVADKLGYDPKKLGDALAAEQIDAIALALDNMERGAGFIIGDQTGIGKGRVVAAIIRYALKSGRRPIFVTEKPNLYADMYRDMNDIGIPAMLGRDVRILMTNAGETVPLDEEGKDVLKTPGATKHNAYLRQVADGGGEQDVIFTTYSQMQAFRGNETERQQVLRALAPGSILIFDESHNAGGQGPAKLAKPKKGDEYENGEPMTQTVAPNRAQFARELAKLAHGVFYSSATYAKRPDVMDLYASTDMRLAVPDIDKLGEAIAKGGVPMQQVVASNLAEAGQYVRRERSFDGITYDTPTVPVDRRAYSEFTIALQAVQGFSERHVAVAVKGFDRDLKAEGKAISGDNSTGGAGAESTNFTAIMHNLVDQMLLSTKADAAAENAIANIRQGKKAVITVANTMASFIEEYAEENGIKPGDPISLDFRALLQRYLERTRIITIRKPFSKEKGERHRLTDGELGDSGVEAFRDARRLIDGLKVEHLPISPIDHIKARIQDAGYKVGEITGRSATIDYRGGDAVFRRRPASEGSIAGRRKAISGFNGGTLDAMILNQAGSTGLSLHASKAFKDKKPRHMIIAQAEKNIDVHMQMLGRVHRSGQVVLPSYDQLTADVPAEKRPTAILAKKMASLNANTTGARDSALTSDEVPDFINQYGDEVAARMMEEDPELHDLLAKPLKQAEGENDDGLVREDAARKVTGRLVLLPLDQQEAFYERFLGEFRDYLAQKEAAGESTMEAKTLPIDARTIDRKQVVAPTQAGTPFGEGVYLETVDAKRLGKPFTPEQVIGQVAQTLGAKPIEVEDSTTRLKMLAQEGARWIAAFQEGPLADFTAYRRNLEDNIADGDRQSKMVARNTDNVTRFRSLLGVAYPGAAVRLESEEGALYGVVTGVERKGQAKNPLALGTYRVTVALADSARQLVIPLSQLTTGSAIEGGLRIEAREKIGSIPMLDAFRDMQRESREQRTIVTGNILAGFDHVNGRGQIVNFVDDQGDIRQGIMMPRDFDYSKDQAKRPVVFRTNGQVAEWVLRGHVAEALGVKLTKSSTNVVIETPASKSTGGQYFLNSSVRLAVGGDFVKAGNSMRATAPLSRLGDIVQALREDAKASFTAREDQEEARALIGEGTGDAKQSRTDDAEPVIRLTGAELGKMLPAGRMRIVLLRDRAMNWFRSNLLNRTLTASDGKPVVLTTKGAKHTVAGKGDIILRGVPAIEALLTKGTRSDVPQKPGTAMRAEMFSGIVEIDGERYRMGVITRTDANGRRQYDLTDAVRDIGGPVNAGLNPNVPGGAASRTTLSDPAMDGTSDAGINLMLLPDNYNRSEPDAMDEARWDRIDSVQKDLRARLAELGVADRVSVIAVDRLFFGERVAGQYLPGGFISVVLDSGKGPLTTLDHEAIHAFRDLGLFLPSEWTALSAAARGDRAMMESVRRRYPDLSEEGQVEEAVADRFARWSNGEDSRGFAARVFERIRDFMRALGDALRGNGFTTAESVMQAMGRGDIGARPDGESQIEALVGGGFGAQSVTAPPAAVHEFENDETEKRFREAAEGLGTGDSLILRTKIGLQNIANGFARHWEALPNVPKYAELQQKLRNLEAAPQAAKERSVRMLSDLVKGFDRNDLDLLARKVILDDLMWEAGQDHELPFGLTPATLATEKARVDAIVDGNPKVGDAALRRKLINRKVAQELVDAGVLDADRIKNPAYFRHQVLDYARTTARLAQGANRKLKSPKWAKRMGSSLDINANLLEAEFDWLNKALTDIPVARAIDWIKKSEHNILAELQQQARDNNKQGLDDLIAKENDPDGEVTRAEKDFRVRIARGFDSIRKVLKAGGISNIPRQFERAADGIENGRRGENAFPFLSWILDNNEAGSIGAATILKALGERRTWTEKTLGRAYIDPSDSEGLVKRLAPEGYATWSPDEGKLLFTVKTLPEHVIDGMLTKIDSVPGIDPGEIRAQLEKARSAMAMGGDRYKMILPQEVATTLNRLRRDDVSNLISEALAVPVAAWKRWVLMNPRRIIKYNLNNLSGDLDAVLAGNPRLLLRASQAAREVAAVMRDKAAPSPRYQEAIERGVFDSGLSIQEIPDINRLSAFANLTTAQSRRPDKAAVAALGKVWRGLQGFTQWRENVFRYAAYLDYVERIEAGEPLSKIGYGASVPAMVDAVTDQKDQAALLARDLIGDYGAISENGAWLRSHLIPFWSWMEINTRRYWRLTSNAYTQGVGKGIATGGALALSAGVRTTAWLAIRAMMVYGLINLWNWMLFDDEDKELSDQQRKQLHIVLGRNSAGEVVTLRTQGAFSDALSWFGLGDAADALKDYQAGRGGWAPIAAAPFKATINKIGTSFSPALTLPIESATGKKLWPDLFATRINRDPWRNVAQTFSLENEYDAANNLPSRGYAGSWIDGVFYRRQPGEIAYDEARGLAYDWLRREKGQEGSSSFTTPRSEALRQYRTALRYGDEGAAAQAMKEMASYGITRKDLAASIKRAAPLGPIPKKDRAAFMASLTPEERAKLERAQEWYVTTFR